MKKEGEVITEHNYPDIYKWLSEHVFHYKENQKHYTLTSEGKINAYCDVGFYIELTHFKYPFGYVKGFFSFSDCKKLTSLIGVPEIIKNRFACGECYYLTSLIGFPKYVENNVYFYHNRFSNDPKHKEKYKLYLAMWLELLESVSNEDRLKYIKNYKDKIGDYRVSESSSGHPIIPIEILKEYGF